MGGLPVFTVFRKLSPLGHPESTSEAGMMTMIGQLGQVVYDGVKMDGSLRMWLNYTAM